MKFFLKQKRRVAIITFGSCEFIKPIEILTDNANGVENIFEIPVFYKHATPMVL